MYPRWISVMGLRREAILKKLAVILIGMFSFISSTNAHASMTSWGS